jgi:hypothetical protein
MRRSYVLGSPAGLTCRRREADEAPASVEIVGLTFRNDGLEVSAGPGSSHGNQEHAEHDGVARRNVSEDYEQPPPDGVPAPRRVRMGTHRQGTPDQNLKRRQLCKHAFVGARKGPMEERRFLRVSPTYRQRHRQKARAIANFCPRFTLTVVSIPTVAVNAGRAGAPTTPRASPSSTARNPPPRWHPAPASGQAAGSR